MVSAVQRKAGKQEKIDKDEEVDDNKTLDLDDNNGKPSDDKEFVKPVWNKDKDDNNKPLEGVQGTVYSFFTTNVHVKFALLIAILSFATRFYKLHLPEKVCWDETHFGKHANYYIKRTFFFDLHPPLGKMLLALAGILTGYDGNHPFTNPGEAFGDAHYLGMRSLCAFFGACVPVLAYGIMLNLQFSTEAAILCGLLLTFDNGLTTLSRYILLDMPLIFFIVGSVYCYTKFYTLRNRPFEFVWWMWLACTGSFLACAFGVKWVGAFVIAFIGLSTIKELWDIFGDQSISLNKVTRHFMARVVCLILLPIALYLSFFAVHFAVLDTTGPGDGFMSSLFQSTLVGNNLYDAENPIAVAYNSEVTVKQLRPTGALLHSHADRYPGEDESRQQVTTYSFKDDNNRWMIGYPYGVNIDTDTPNFVKHGDVIRMIHIPTSRYLQSDDTPAPITTEHKRVACNGHHPNLQDEHQLWRVELDGLDEVDPEKVAQDTSDKYRLSLLTTKFRLIHTHSGCALTNNGVKLPQWGFDQGEVTCSSNREGPGTLWNIESIIDARLPKKKVSALQPGFLSMVLELHQVMGTVNNDLIPKKDEDPSKPWHWPILFRGQNFTPWGNDDHRIVLLGNPVIWMFNLAALAVFLIAYLMNMALYQRGWECPAIKERRATLQNCGGWVLIGYLLHYVPFYFMSRVLYVHHYYPALVFACMISAMILDEIIFWIGVGFARLGMMQPHRVTYTCVALCICVMVVSFIHFSPFTYGMTGPRVNYNYLQWGRQWQI